MSKHTPGPWEAIMRTCLRASIQTAGSPHLQVAEINGPYTPGHDRYVEDAALIAAAPDLLAVCQRAAGALGSPAGLDSLEQRLQLRCELLAAIALAGGELPPKQEDRPA